ncbi:hypothetical protein Tco_1296098 [Tanacetum coccineum]
MRVELRNVGATDKGGAFNNKVHFKEVIVANGNNMVSSNMCSVKWRLQTTKFCDDMMLLPSDGCEMVLGIHWLSTLGNITCHFKDLNWGSCIMTNGYSDKYTFCSPVVLKPLFEEYEDVFDVPK